MEQISSFRTRFHHHIHADNQDWLMEVGVGGTERGICSKQMSVPCSKPLQHKSSPEDGQNLAEVWAISSFSSPCSLTSLSESQLQFNWDLLKAKAEFYQHQEKSKSLRGGLTSPERCSCCNEVTMAQPRARNLEMVCYYLTMIQPDRAVREVGRKLKSFPEMMDLGRDLWGWPTLSAETLPRVSLPSLDAQTSTPMHRHLRWISKGKTGWYNSVFPVWGWMSVLLHMAIILFSMCFPFIPVLTLRLDVAGGCRGKGRGEKEPELSLIKIIWAFKVHALRMNQCGFCYVRAQGRLWRTHGPNKTTHLFLEIKFRCFWGLLLDKMKWSKDKGTLID